MRRYNPDPPSHFLRALLCSLVLSLGCHAIAVPPTSPTVVTPPPTPPPEPPTLPLPPPIALTLTLGNADPRAGEGLSLLASAISGQPTAPATYVWHFGDQTSATTSTSSAGHVYAQAGSYEARVDLTDANGRTAQASRIVVVTERPREPRPPRDPPPPPPELGVSLTCTAKAAPNLTPCNVTVSYDGTTLRSSSVTNVDWDWGDGETSSTSGPSDSHTYVQAGTYTVFAEVTANTKDGSKTGERSLTINVP